MNTQVEKIDKSFMFLSLFFMLLYIAGFRVVYVSGVCVVLLVFWMLFCSRHKHVKPPEGDVIFLDMKNNDHVAKIFFLLFFCLLTELGLSLFFDMRLGRTGIDFAIFTQAIAAIGRDGIPWVSLMTGSPLNFVTHHFVPYLYVPGALAALGVPASTAGAITHFLGLTFGLFALGGIGRTQGLSRNTALALMVAAAFSPTLRISYTWTMNDELYGAPYVMLGLWAWLSGRYALCTLFFCISCLCKESFFLVTLAFTGVALLWHADFRPAEERKRAALWLVPLGMVSGLLFVGYFFLQPIILGKPFDHASKLATFTQLLNPLEIAKKLLYVLTLLLPTFGVPLIFSKGRKLLVIAVPSLSLSMITSFGPMYEPFRYYSSVPIFVNFAALVVSWPDLRIRWRAQQVARYVVLLCVGSVMLETFSPMESIVRGIRAPSKAALPQTQFPLDGVYVVDPAAAVQLAGYRHLERVWLANQRPERHFDRLIWKPGGYETPSAALIERTYDCGSTAFWQIRCRR